ncbi:nuclear transport factor 2 family protein [Rhodococcus sp. CX]|uniref:nuclear transport factor 2 family protein n=1 Tax=Rhodococcus sp. CX TaxID=2789880 RepID=UPI0018CE013B|nr:nuclear transport factor 2 family protein [Rhodococcus sp. CX]MBH0122625.1 nuclear transport factor 2 family protein [Rhodococcus sp. CX]
MTTRTTREDTVLFAPRAQPSDPAATLQLVYDRQQIIEVLHRYARAIDRCDIKLLESVYHEDATDAHGSFDGNAHEFAAFMVPRLAEQTTYSIHHVTNELVEVDGDRAIAESCLLGYHRIPGGRDSVARFFGDEYADRAEADGTLEGEHEYLTGGRYLDKLLRRDGVWRIWRRRITVEWNQCQPSRMVIEGGRSKYNLPGSRDLGDPSYRLNFESFDE